MNFDKELDVRKLACPMPVVKTKKALVGMSPGSVSDMQAFAEATGHELLSTETSGEEFVFFMKK
jgi:tRNA 2-thiouridine synthesizing protein A